MKKIIGRWVERRLGGYRRQINRPDATRPRMLSSARKVIVAGGGLAGIACGALLSERGFGVTILEKNDYLGGKLGAWKKAFADGSEAWVDHGFHAFFRQYYNLRQFLAKIGASGRLAPIGDYLIRGVDASLSFGGTETTPLLNLLAMRTAGLFRLRDIFSNPRMFKLMEFLRYSPERSFDLFDDVSFQDYADSIGLPPMMRRVFISFTRAFFADPDKISYAELLKSFHFFYLSHDFGIDYDYLTGDCERLFARPAGEYLKKHGVEILLGCTVEKVENKGTGLLVGGRDCDYFILAADPKGARRIAEASPAFAGDPEWREKIVRLKSAQGYAVYKIWTDRPLLGEYPPFFITDRFEVLDAFTQFHLFDPEAAAWAASNGGAVYELHCYAVPERYFGNDEKIKALFMEEAVRFFPELKGCRLLRESFHMNDDFTAFHKGLHGGRPSTAGRIANIFAAGDWVRLDMPAMLMEGAFSSGLLAANCVLAREGLAEEPIWSVPLRGIFAGKPESGPFDHS